MLLIIWLKSIRKVNIGMLQLRRSVIYSISSGLYTAANGKNKWLKHLSNRLQVGESNYPEHQYINIPQDREIKNMSFDPINNELIKYENIGISFENKKVISDFNLSVKKKQKVLMRGKSGTGKTTLLKLLLGFTKPAEGTLYFQSQAIDSKTCWEARKKIAYVVQDTDLGEGKVKNLLNDIFSQYFQLLNNINSNIFIEKYHLNLVGDWEINKFPTNTFGLGNHTSWSDINQLDFWQLRFYQVALREISPNFFTGIGYHCNYYWNIKELNKSPNITTDFDKYGFTNHSFSSAISHAFKLRTDFTSSINSSFVQLFTGL